MQRQTNDEARLEYLIELLHGSKDLRLMNSHVIKEKKIWWSWFMAPLKDPRGVICSGQIS